MGMRARRQGCEPGSGRGERAEPALVAAQDLAFDRGRVGLGSRFAPVRRQFGQQVTGRGRASRERGRGKGEKRYLSHHVSIVLGAMLFT